jgi:epoxyqueuosine reductase
MSSSDPAVIRQRLHDRALELGFSLFGVSRADSEPDLRDRLFQWLTRGYHASMAWMARNAERRADPQKVLPGAQSIISVAINYYHPEQHDEECGALKVSRYAWGDDYHTLVAERLEALRQTLEELLPGTRSLTYVDTGPLLEKAIAQRAGLGWIGKNACLITRDFGSWVFLGEIITTAELPPDLPHTDFCGSCSRCLEACPTEAFAAPYVLDANRCISYWTIEHRGEIPEELSSQFDGWIFGCDICQDVCPWNKFSRPSPEPAFAPLPERRRPPGPRWSSLSPEAFRAEFANSPILRARAEGLARNIRSQCADPLPLAVRQARAQSPSIQHL